MGELLCLDCYWVIKQFPSSMIDSLVGVLEAGSTNLIFAARLCSCFERRGNAIFEKVI